VDVLRSARTPTAKAHRRPGYIHTIFSPASVLSLSHVLVAALVRLYAPFLDASGDLVQWKMDIAAIGWAGLAATH